MNFSRNFLTACIYCKLDIGSFNHELLCHCQLHNKEAEVLQNAIVMSLGVLPVPSSIPHYRILFRSFKICSFNDIVPL